MISVKYCLVVLLSVSCSGADGQSLVQSEAAVTSPGGSHKLTCTYVGFSSDQHIAWIRQAAGKGLEWISWIRYDGADKLYSDSVKGRFTVSRDNSRKEVYLHMSGLRADDTALYYCARDRFGVYDYFDYWGKGTSVTVAAATQSAPSIFPAIPCNTDSADTVTLACLATGFNPAPITFEWTKNETALTNSIQYPSILQNNAYSGISQIDVSKQDWDQYQYKCIVKHSSSTDLNVKFSKPNVIYQIPTLTMMTSEEDEHVTFSCLAKHFSPNVYEFKWMKNDAEINNTMPMYTTPSTSVKSDSGTTYSAASFLTLPRDEVQQHPKFMCKFTVGKGTKQQLTNATQEYAAKCNSGSGSPEATHEMRIIPPSSEDMLYKLSGKVICEVTVKEQWKVHSVDWEDEKGNKLMTDTDKEAQVKGGHYLLPLHVSYKEWNEGIQRFCKLNHDDLVQGDTKMYERKNGKASLKPPTVFMLSPLKQTRDDKVVLTCYVKDFYPKDVYVMWLVDDKETMHEYNTTNSMSTNGAYYAYSHLIVPLGEWEKATEQVYSCLVYHEGINQNKNIVRSITQYASQQTTMVNLNMRVPDMCLAQ